MLYCVRFKLADAFLLMKTHSYATTAALLATAWLCLPFNILLAAAALWQGMSVALPSGVSVALMLWVLWLHIRVDFDRRILKAWLAGQGNAETFDADVQRLGLGTPKIQDSVTRCRGAIRWWRRLLWATVVQGLWLLCLCVWF